MNCFCSKMCCPVLIATVAVLVFFLREMTPFAPMYRRKPAMEFLGPLTPNNVLDSAERFLEGTIGFGPESVAIHPNGKMYTGIADGRIMEISGTKVKTLVHVGGESCVKDHKKRELACGRPLGIRIDAQGDLVVADAIKGIYKVSVNTGKITPLVLSSTEVNGKTIDFADDLAITKAGDIYFSDIPSWNIHTPLWQWYYKSIRDGRVLHFDPKTKKLTTVLDNLETANGVELSPNEDFLLVSQTFGKSILRYHLKGPKKGQAEKFVDIPGFADNIRASGRGTYWVAICFAHVPFQTSLWDMLECHCLKYIVYSSLQLTANILDLLVKVIPLEFLKVLDATVHGYTVNTIHQPSYGLVLEINENGEILRSLQSPKGHVPMITEAREHQGTLYLASFFNQFLAKIKLQ